MSARAPRRASWLAAFLLPVALAAAACSGGAATLEPQEEPLRKEPVEGTDLTRLVLSARAAERLDIQSIPVARDGRGLLVPAGAVLVDAQGAFWVYTRPRPLVFLRQPVILDRFEGETALLKDGPDEGMEVVTLGAAELFGAEFGIGK